MIVLTIAAILVVGQSVGWLWGAGKFEEDLHQARLGYEHAAFRSYRVEFTVDRCYCLWYHVRVTVVDGEIVEVENMVLPTPDYEFPDGVLSTSTHFDTQDRWMAKYVVFPPCGSTRSRNSWTPTSRCSASTPPTARRGVSTSTGDEAPSTTKSRIPGTTSRCSTG